MSGLDSDWMLILAIRNEHQKVAEVKQAGSEMTKAFNKNVAICCVYIHKYDSDRHYNVAGDVHLKGSFGIMPTFLPPVSDLEATVF